MKGVKLIFSHQLRLASVEIHKNIYARLSGEPEMEGGDPAEAEYDYKENKIYPTFEEMKEFLSIKSKVE